jgi:hypothetical protein
MTATIPMLRARVGDTHVAMELAHVVSLLDPSQTEDLEVILVSAALGEPYQAPTAVALLDSDGHSIALGLDAIAGYEHWDRSRLARLPKWLARHLPDILKPACGMGDDGNVVWIIHPPAFAQPRE